MYIFEAKQEILRTILKHDKYTMLFNADNDMRSCLLRHFNVTIISQILLI